jgi:hypothetical protein
VINKEQYQQRKQFSLLKLYGFALVEMLLDANTVMD